MSRFHKWILSADDPKVVIKRSTAWNLLASLLNAGLTAIILFFMSWTGNREMSGIFSIATAIAYQVQAIGFFGVRNYHITDVNDKYSFSDYVYLNIISSVIMVAALAFMAFGRGYDQDKALVVLTYSLYRIVDIYEALFHDEYQRAGRIDIGLILQTIRFLVSLLVLILILLITHSLVWACFFAFASSLVIIWYQNKDFCEIFNCHLKKSAWLKVKSLFLICLPICISGFISMYLANASKYAIDRYLDDRIQGVFAILFIPVFTINMLSTVIYRPYITRISMEWHLKKTGSFLRSIIKQMLVITGLTVLITLFGDLVGLKLLGMIYNIDLTSWKLEFVILLLGGGLNTYAAFLSQILVIVGKQNSNLLIYAISLVITIILAQPLTVKFGLRGASILYMTSAALLTIGSIIIIIKQVRARGLE